VIIIGISGKSDFQDHVEMFDGADNLINNYRIYAHDNDVIPLKFEKPADLIAYYPYLVVIRCADKDGGIIHLSSESFIDSEEKEQLQWRMDRAKAVYRRCKRKKIPFDREAAVKDICWIDEPKPFEVEIIDRVERDGNKATIEDIHDPMHDRMRDMWYELMIDNGWDENKAYKWVYGWYRWLDRIQAEKYGENFVQQTIGSLVDDSNGKS
jgi:hypothetical protein